MVRLRNDTVLVPWGIISDASSHGNNSGKIPQHVSMMFGFSTHYQALERFVEKYVESLSFENQSRLHYFYRDLTWIIFMMVMS